MNFISFTTTDGQIICLNKRYIQLIACQPDHCVVWLFDNREDVGYPVSEDEAERIIKELTND